jgi:hypothetical protein
LLLVMVTKVSTMVSILRPSIGLTRWSLDSDAGMPSVHFIRHAFFKVFAKSRGHPASDPSGHQLSLGDQFASGPFFKLDAVRFQFFYLSLNCNSQPAFFIVSRRHGTTSF